MFLPSDEDEFLHVGRFDDAFILIKKNMELDHPYNYWSIVRADFEHSREFTDLKTARDLCYMILDQLGVKTYDKHSESGLRLAIEIIKEKKESVGHTKASRVKN